MDALSLGPASVTEPGVRDLLLVHQGLMQDGSPAESCHVMDPESLMEAGAVLVAARRGDAVLGVGAVKQIGPGHGEIKSMHTAASARGQGIARAILNALMDQAREMGLSQLSLETGSADSFSPARALYGAHGFATCPPFAPYVEDPNSVFMTRRL